MCLGRDCRDQGLSIFLQRFPLVGEQLPQAADRVAHDSPEHVIEILPRIDLAILAGFDQSHEQSSSTTSPFASHENPIFSAQGYRTHGILRKIIVGPQPAIFQITAKSFLLIQGIIHSLAERLRRDRLSPQFFELFGKIPSSSATECSWRKRCLSSVSWHRGAPPW